VGLTSMEAADLRGRLGPVGVWLGSFGELPVSVEQEAAREIEALGYGALWYSEGGKEPLAHGRVLLEATDQMLVGSGIASIFNRDPVSMLDGAASLEHDHEGRFILGFGVSHERFVTARGQDYSKPVAKMRDYLAAIEAAAAVPLLPKVPVPVVLAALRPAMLQVATDHADGAHPYFVPVAHTRRARAALGPDRLLAPELMVLVDTDPVRAKAIARSAVAFYLTLPNYANDLRSLGYTKEDLVGGGSDRLVDDLVGWGSAEAVGQRVDEHLAAGADHVAVQPLGSLDDQLRQLRLLASALIR
jgi:probable F420-dependent oxidoreductase